MSVLVISDIPGGTVEGDQAIVEAMNLRDNAPAGARLRLSGPTETGWRVMSLWDSRESFDTFLRDRLMPALQQAGRAAPEFTFWPVESVIIR